MVVFGWYSWLIRYYTPQQLGLVDSSWDNIRFEVRQKCFHVCFIPFFSIGKMYVMRKEGQMYGVTPEFESHMRSVELHKTPWYSYLGLILIPLCFILYWGSEQYDSYRRIQNNKEYIAEKLDRIENPQLHDFYKLTTQNYNSCVMRVENFTKDSILIGMPSVLSDENRYFSEITAMNEYFDGLGSQLWTAWIAKSDLKEAIDRDPTSHYNFEGKAFPELLETDSFKINDIERSGD